MGSCGTAAFLKEKVIVSDIETDYRWANFRELARAGISEGAKRMKNARLRILLFGDTLYSKKRCAAMYGIVCMR